MISILLVDSSLITFLSFSDSFALIGGSIDFMCGGILKEGSTELIDGSDSQKTRKKIWLIKAEIRNTTGKKLLIQNTRSPKNVTVVTQPQLNTKQNILRRKSI